jgi:hypothetical protein
MCKFDVYQYIICTLFAFFKSKHTLNVYNIDSLATSTRYWFKLSLVWKQMYELFRKFEAY